MLLYTIVICQSNEQDLKKRNRAGSIESAPNSKEGVPLLDSQGQDNDSDGDDVDDYLKVLPDEFPRSASRKIK